jgi:hypothetical protein
VDDGARRERGDAHRGKANAANAGVLVDALHFGRSTSSLADVKALPATWL